MDTDVRTQPTYDPNVTYAGSCSATRIYWRTGTGNPPACSTDRWFNQAANQCNLGALALGSAGFFIDTMAQYDTSSGSGGRRWETISSTQKDRLVECQDDNGLHGDGNPLTAVYPLNGQATAANAWTALPTSGITWGQTPANQIYTIYSGNYLNWFSGPTALQPRLKVVQDVATNLLNTLNGVNVGLMHFNGEQGGLVKHAMENIATGRASMISDVNGLTAGGYTPLSETLYEAALYFRGGKVDYGNPGSVAASRNPSDTSLYQSPLNVSCQKNFIVYLTDGEPTRDVDADAKIVAMTDATGASFGSFVPGGTCDAETYPAGFSPSGGECLDDLAEFMYEGDLSSQPGKQSVTTYTIGFTVDLPILADTAARSGGAYYTANDTATLSNALSNIVTSILDTQTTFISPTVSVNSFNRTRNLNDLFISVFKASPGVHWPGN
jgi:type IV pilus assembly protein PilY1